MGEPTELQPFSVRDEETISFIPEDLRKVVVTIIKEGSSPKGVASLRELYERAERGDPYLIAAAVYDFLWKKVAAESRRDLYPVVGDFFITALEQRLATIGPNNMSSRFAELMDCYKGAADTKHRLEGPLYCADLFLLKTTQLALGAGSGQTPVVDAPESEPRRGATFLHEEKLSVEEQIAHSLKLAREALLSAQDYLSKLSRQNHGLEERYLRFIRSTMDRLTASWQQWQEMHTGKDIHAIEPEDYFREGIARAEKVNSLVLAALLLEQVGEEYQDKMCREFLNHRFSSKPADHPSRGCTFDAGEIYRDQGTVEREHGAFILSERRFTRAITVFNQLHDRTSVAQTLIERARLYMARKTDAWKAHRDLHLAAQHVAAVQKRLAPGHELPPLAPQQVLHFYVYKGLNLEAETYKELEPTFIG